MANLSKRSYPPKFQPQKWDNYSKTGCYTYALNIKKKAFFLVGDFIGKRCTYRTNVKDLLKTFRLEVKTLGFSVREIQLEDLEHLKPGEYAIYLKRDKQIGYYHFFRRVLWTTVVILYLAGTISFNPSDALERPSDCGA